MSRIVLDTNPKNSAGIVPDYMSDVLVKVFPELSLEGI